MILRFALLSLLLLSSASADLAVGDCVCHEGFIMDQLCIDLVTLLDNPRTRTLQRPEIHSLHCLVDVRACYRSGFTVLAEPDEPGGMYSVAAQLDPEGTESLLHLARSAGRPGYCRTCTGAAGDETVGFRATVVGTVTALGDATSTDPIDKAPSVTVTDVFPSSVGCAEFSCPGPPTTSPTLELSEAPTVAPLDESEAPTSVPLTAQGSPDPTSGATRTNYSEEPTGSPVNSMDLSQDPTDYSASIPMMNETDVSDSPSYVPEAAADVPADASSGSPTETPEESYAPTQTSSEFPTLEPTPVPTQTPTLAPTSGPTLNPSESTTAIPTTTPVDCRSLRNEVVLNESPLLTFRYTVNVPGSNSNVQLTPQEVAAGGSLTGELTYQGEAWVAIARSRFGGMIGSEAIICRPRENTVLKYNLNVRGVSGIVPFPDDQQTLADASVTQQDGVTVCKFTKLLNEVDELPITAGSDNTFVWATGFSNTLGYHQLRNRVTIALETCSS